MPAALARFAAPLIVTAFTSTASYFGYDVAMEDKDAVMQSILTGLTAMFTFALMLGRSLKKRPLDSSRLMLLIVSLLAVVSCADDIALPPRSAKEAVDTLRSACKAMAAHDQVVDAVAEEVDRQTAPKPEGPPATEPPQAP